MGILVAATATPGTLIHTAVSGTLQTDSIWLWAQNNDSADDLLTIEFGDATAPDHNIIKTIKAKSGVLLVVPGFVLQNGKTVKAFAGVANKLTLTGFVNRGP